MLFALIFLFVFVRFEKTFECLKWITKQGISGKHRQGRRRVPGGFQNFGRRPTQSFSA